LRTLREKLAVKRLTESKSENTEVIDTMGTETTTDDVSAESMEAQLRDLDTLVKNQEKAAKSGHMPAVGEPTKDEVKAEMERLRIGIARLKGREPQSQEEREYNQHRTRMEKLEALEKLRKLEAAAKGDERKRLHSQRVALEKELGIKEDADVRIEINKLRKGMGQDPYGEEYGHLETNMHRKDGKADDDKDGLEVGEKRLRSDDGDDTSKDLDGHEPSVTMGKGAFDIDTEMPYGELEPFGREDTAQELTESSIHESDEMVDQLERAEVAEEKRAVFRALTRLRGAAITSFDGVARSQTGNIDEYNKTHKWRKTHPLHHLADEESDISKWAFPDNADF